MDSTSRTEQLPPSAARLARPDWRQIAHEAVQDHRAIQHSTELAVLLQLADNAEVRTVLEIGTFAGGSAWAFAQLPSVGRIITVDRGPQAEAYSRIRDLAPSVTLITGYSEAPDTRQHVLEHLQGTPPDLLFIDGGHDLQSAADDFRTYGPMVRPGGIIVMHPVEHQLADQAAEVQHLWASVRHAYPSITITAAPGEWAGLGLIWR